MSKLSQLTSLVARSQKRVGRGIGSGKGGHTVGRGTKGQKSRTGGQTAIWFEGGQLPLIKRLPMWRGKSRFNVVRPVAEVNLSDLNKMTSQTITLDTLKLEKVIDHRFKSAKVVQSGTLKRSVVTKGLKVSKGAEKDITKSGGRVESN